MSWLELRVPPPIVALVCALTMYLLARIFEAWRWVLPGALPLSLLVALVGVGIALAGVSAFRRHRTTVNPLHPENSTAVVSTGIYRRTRNPMYLGMLVVLLGFAVWLGNSIAPVMLIAFVLYLNRFQIMPEERALLAKFGSEYADYMRRVRRWV